MTSITSLIERIEAATEGSRELDVAVILALHPEAGPYQPHCQGDEPIFWNAPYRKMRCPEISTSIDAALTLLPEGWWWSAGVCRRENHASVGSEIGTVEGELIFETFGATAPLALLAAILRARQAAQSGQAQTEARG